MRARPPPKPPPDDAVPNDYRAPWADLGEEPVSIRMQRRRLAELPSDVLLTELRLRGVLPTDEARPT